MASNILHYTRRGGTSNTHGPKFEMDLTCLTYIRCYKLYKDNKVKSFLIANNMDHVGAFDDVVCRIEYEENGSLQTRLIFVQLKHCSQTSSKKFSDSTFFNTLKQRKDEKAKYREEGVKTKMEGAHRSTKNFSEDNDEEGSNIVCNKEMQKYVASYLQIRHIFDENETRVTGVYKSSDVMKDTRKQLKDIFNCKLNQCLFVYYTNATKVKEMKYFVPLANMNIITNVFDTSSKTGIHILRLGNMKLSDLLTDKYKNINEDEMLQTNEFENYFNVYSNQEKQQSLEEEIKNEIGSYLNVSNQTVESIYACLLDEFQYLFRQEKGPFLTEKINYVENIHYLVKLQTLAMKIEEKYEKWLSMFSTEAVENLYKIILNEEYITIPCKDTKNLAFVISIQLVEKIRESNKSNGECNENVIEPKQSVLFLYIENSASFEMWKSVRNLHNYTKYREVLLCVENDISNDVQRVISTECKNRELYVSLDNSKCAVQHSCVRHFSTIAIENILNHKVKFQCFVTTLREIFSDTHYQEIFKVFHCNGMLDILITRVFNDEDITIGSSLPDEEDIYIDRKFKKNIISLNYQANLDCRELFFLYPKQNVPQSFEVKKAANIFIFENKEDAFHHYELRLEGNQGIHFCLAKDSCMEVLCSKGNIENISKFVTEHKQMDEAALLQHILNNKFTILSDDVGMGKSTALKHLTRLIKNERKEYWVQFIDLNSQSEYLKTLKTKNPIESISTDLLKLEHMDKMIFQHKCNTEGNVALLFDGFDELDTQYRKDFIQFLTALSYTKIKTFVIATRTIVASELNVCLETFSFSLLGFNYEDMASYLKQYWSMKGCNKQHVKLSKLVSNIVEYVKENKYTLTEVATVPLQTKMLALTYNDEIQNALSIENLTTLHIGPLSLYSLYSNFIDMHINRCIEEKLNLHASSNSYRTIKDMYKPEADKWEALACKEIFSSIEMSEVITTDTDIQKLQQIGIIVNIDPIKFVHRSFAEFLAAKYVSRMLYESKKTKYLNYIYKVICVDKAYIVLRKFMNAFYENERHWETAKIIKKGFIGSIGFVVDERILLLSIEERNVYIFKVILRHLSNNQSVLQRILNYKTDYDRSLLHLSTEYCEEVFDDIFHSKLFYSAKACDKDFRTALHYACILGRENAVRSFVNKVKNKTLIAIINNIDEFQRTPLIYAAQGGHTNIVKLLQHNGASIYKKTFETGPDALYFAASAGHIEIVKYLIEHGVHINGKYISGNTVLMVSCQGLDHHVDGDECIRYIVEHAGADVNLQNERGKTALMFLIMKNDNIDCLKYLIQHGADINALDWKERNAAMFAAKYGQKESLNYLIELGVDVLNKVDASGDTSFTLCSGAENSSVLQYFIEEHKPNLDYQNYEGETALFRAVSSGRFDNVKLLITHGASVNVCNNKGDTALPAAVDKQVNYSYLPSSWQEKTFHGIVSYLVQHGSDINQKNHLGNSMLHLLLHLVPVDYDVVNFIELINLLVELGADIDLKNKEGVTPVMMAQQHTDVVAVKGSNSIGHGFVKARGLTW